MNARFLKKMRYRRLLSTTAQNTPITNMASVRDARNTRAIERDVARLFGNDYSAAWNWYVTPALALNGKRPVDLVSAGNLRSVRELLIRLEYGVYT